MYNIVLEGVACWAAFITGNTRKDEVGVALDIFIKTMSTVAITLASVFSHSTLIK